MQFGLMSFVFVCTPMMGDECIASPTKLLILIVSKVSFKLEGVPRCFGDVFRTVKWALLLQWQI